MRVKAAIALTLLAGCARSGAGQMATHVEVLTAVARKGVDLVAHGRLTAESLPELTYPFERARAFAHAARTAGGTAPAALDAFDALLARYREFLDALDRVRREKRGEDARATLAEPLAAVEAAGARVRGALGGVARGVSPAAGA